MVQISPASFKRLQLLFPPVLNDAEVKAAGNQVTVAPLRCNNRRGHSRRVRSELNCVSWCSPFLPGRLLRVWGLAPRLFLAPPSNAGWSCREYLAACWKKKKSPHLLAGRWDRGGEDRGNCTAYCKAPSQPRSFESPGDVPSSLAAVFQHRMDPGSLSPVCYSPTNTLRPRTDGARCSEVPLRGGT